MSTAKTPHRTRAIVTEFDLALGRRLQAERLEFGMRQASVRSEARRIYGRQCGFSQNIISGVEKGTMQIGVGRFIQLCEVLRIDPIEVFTEVMHSLTEQGIDPGAVTTETNEDSMRVSTALRLRREAEDAEYDRLAGVEDDE